VKRGGPIQRRTPLRRIEPMPNTTRPIRNKSLRRQSKKGAAADRTLAASKRIVRERSGGMCEAGPFTAEVCTGTADHVHHVIPRSSGRDDSPSNLLDLCHACHAWVHAHPAESRRAGLLGTAIYHRVPPGENQ
jgi:5-methylcytosine-specific restriction endonuclease McrA